MENLPAGKNALIFRSFRPYFVLYAWRVSCVWMCVFSGNVSNQSPAVIDDNNKLPAGVWKTGRGAGR